MKETIRKKGKKLIQESKLRECLDFLLNWIKKEHDLYNDLSYFSADYNRNEKDKRLGTISTEDYDRKYSTIRANISAFIDEIEDSALESDTADIFINHAPEDAELAIALEDFLNEIGQHNNISALSAESLRKELENEQREREVIRRSIVNAKVVLIIITPGTTERPRIVFELGRAVETDRNVKYINYFINTPATLQQLDIANSDVFHGDKEEDIIALLNYIYEVYYIEANELERNNWIKIFNENNEADDNLRQGYLGRVTQQLEFTLSKRLFLSQFHDNVLAERLCGEWYARWTWYDDKDGGKEKAFETDQLHIWSSEFRLRVIGYSAKKDLHLHQDFEKLSYYPMEGVVSARAGINGYVALSYWSAKELPYCGGCLMEVIDATETTLIGDWIGYTTISLKEDPRIYRGRAIWSRFEEQVKNFPDES